MDGRSLMKAERRATDWRCGRCGFFKRQASGHHLICHQLLGGVVEVTFAPSFSSSQFGSSYVLAQQGSLALYWREEALHRGSHTL
jgi:hypothetical protein